MTHLLTKARIQALSRINRFNGWTSRPYSVLEHTVLGAAALERSDAHKDVVRAFLLHDVHETEFGDEVRPVQRDYPNPSLIQAKLDYDHVLYGQCGISSTLIGCNIVANMDNLMCSIELNHPTLVTCLTDRECPEYEHVEKSRIIAGINDEVLRGDLAVEAWWALWD